MADERKSITSSTYSGYSGSGETAKIAAMIETKPWDENNFYPEHPRRGRNAQRTRPSATSRPDLRNREKDLDWYAH
ncbi:hypothetical protein FOPE_05643 [Fonsecaea pedrosoi]|nr:hypothetical protein FOPE_05643 [Fonsecaea pedrosoi]